jgi:myo-inositol catabolism protein IolC
MDTLLVLAFDHRGSFQKKLFSIDKRAPTADEWKRIKEAKRIIFDGFVLALEQGVVSAQESAILVDEEAGRDILNDAKQRGIMCAMPVEKSGQDVFDFEAGDPGFQEHILRVDPTFVKVLIRYNPDDGKKEKEVQQKRLKKLNDFLMQQKKKFLLEVLVPASEKQLAKVNGDEKRYEVELRPTITVASVKELQQAGIDPQIWKLEGMETEKDIKTVAKQVQSFNPKASIVILGRGESAEKAKHWLSQAKKVKGVVGFAIGRTVFMEPLKAFVSGKQDKKKTIQQIAQNYSDLAKLWKS